MASINKLVCDHCDHEHIFISNKTYVILEDGSEKRWPEPGGFSMGGKTFTEETRKWSEFRKKGRIISRYPLVCISCGNMDYYGPHYLDVVTPSKSHRLKRWNLDCKHCGEGKYTPGLASIT
jgi:hypothetical protein